MIDKVWVGMRGGRGREEGKREEGKRGRETGRERERRGGEGEKI